MSTSAAAPRRMRSPERLRLSIRCLPCAASFAVNEGGWRPARLRLCWMRYAKSGMPNWAGALMVVVDAGVVLGLILPLPFSDQASAAMRAFSQAGEELYAPALLEYEVCSALRRAISQGVIDAACAEQATEWIGDLRIRPIAPASSLHARALHWASRLGQSKAYDAQYVALAEQMNCPLVTADQRLIRAARTLGADWVTGLD